MTYLNQRHSSTLKSQRIIGIEITNNSLDAHDLTFLGSSHKKAPEGVQYRNALGETLFDDASGLLELRNWITSVGKIKVEQFRIQSTSEYYLAAKSFSVGYIANDKKINILSSSLGAYRDPYAPNLGMIRITKSAVIDINTYLKITEVQPNEIVTIVMFLADDKDQYGEISYEEIIQDLESKTSKENKRKLLLIM